MQRTIQRCAPLIKMINGSIEKKSNNDLQKYGITNVQMHVMMSLYHSDNGEYSLKELEKMFGVAQSTIAGVVSRLEAKQLVKGIFYPKDKRVKKIRLTEEGAEICGKSEKNLTSTEVWLAAGLTMEEKREFLRLLQKVYGSIRERELI